MIKNLKALLIALMVLMTLAGLVACAPVTVEESASTKSIASEATEASTPEPTPELEPIKLTVFAATGAGMGCIV